MTESLKPMPPDIEVELPSSDHSLHPSSKRKAESLEDVHNQLMQGKLNKSNLRVPSSTLDSIREGGGAAKKTKTYHSHQPPPYTENRAATPHSSPNHIFAQEDTQQDVPHGTPPIRHILASCIRDVKAFWVRTRRIVSGYLSATDDAGAEEMDVDSESIPATTLEINSPTGTDPPQSSSSDVTSPNRNSSAQEETDSSLDGINEDNRSNGPAEEHMHRYSSSLESSAAEAVELKTLKISHESESTARTAKGLRSALKNDLTHSAPNEISPNGLSPPPASECNPSSSRGSTPGPATPPAASPPANEKKDTGIFAKTSLIAYLDGFKTRKRIESAVITLDSGSDIDAIASFWVTRHNLKRSKSETPRTFTAINGESVTITEWVHLACKFEGKKEWIKLWVIEDNDDFEILFGAETIKAKGIYKKNGSGQLYIATDRGPKRLSEGKYLTRLYRMDCR